NGKALGPAVATGGAPVCVATAPAVDLLAVATRTGKADKDSPLRIRVLRAGTGQGVRAWVVDPPVERLCFAADGRTLAAVSPHQIVLWDVPTGEVRGIFPATALGINGAGKAVTTFRAAALAGDGRALAVAPNDGPVHVWDVVAPGKPVKLGEPRRPFVSVA